MVVHLVSFQWPVPADYGGVIDVFHKIAALRRMGADVCLHSFAYRDRENPDVELSPANETHIYRRDLGMHHLMSFDPFIVMTRKNRELLYNLRQLPAGTPIIFEGLHTTAWLSNPGLKDKLKIVRAHNVEHDYYSGLSKKAKGTRKAFLAMEAAKLKRYEGNLRHADVILAISEADRRYFEEKFPDVKVACVPCFFNDRIDGEIPEPLEGSGEKYMLYHGTLSVEENAHAVEYILRQLMPLLGSETELRIAGKGASPELKRLIEDTPGAVLYDSPSAPEMRALIRDAAVTLLITDQDTGIKLKLLDTLALARGSIVVSPEMVGDDALRPLLKVAARPAEQVEKIREALENYPGREELEQRREVVKGRFGTDANAARIIEIIDSAAESNRPTAL